MCEKTFFFEYRLTPLLLISAILEEWCSNESNGSGIIEDYTLSFLVIGGEGM